MGANMTDLARIEVTSRAQLRSWLEVNHRQSASVWLVTYKKSARPELCVPWEEVVQELLCFGWIDSQAARLDDERGMVRISPRKPGSAWSAVNKRYVEELSRSNLIQEAGWERILEARRDGSWEFLDDVEAGIIPDDLVEAFDATPGSRDRFDGFPRSTTKATLEWIKRAKRPDTRRKRVAETVRKSAEGVRPR
jgi:uncharacterized protein YdeI (YjbR/CyaY-like superfamily)